MKVIRLKQAFSAAAVLALLGIATSALAHSNNSDAAEASTDSKAPPSIADQNAAFQKRKAEQAEKDKKSAQETKQKADKAAKCTNARAQQTPENRRILNECQ